MKSLINDPKLNPALSERKNNIEGADQLPSPIAQEMYTMQDAICNINHHISALEKKISPILIDSIDDEKSDSTDMLKQSPLKDALSDRNEQLNLVIGRIISIISRAQL